jgi:alanine racemase
MNSSWIEINVKAVSNNIHQIKSRMPVKFFAGIVKSNAYGHGLVPMAKYIENEVDYLAVGVEEEGIELRNNGVKAPILILGPYFDAERTIDYDLTPTVDTVEKMKKLDKAAGKKSAGQYPFHLKINISLNRFGLDEKDLGSFMEAYQALKSVKMEGVYSHFAANRHAEKIIFQSDRLKQCVEIITKIYGVRPAYIHMANSAIAVKYPDLGFNMIRIGNAMFGQAASRNGLHFEETFELKTPLLEKREIKTGSTAGYGDTKPLNEPMTIGLIPLGEAHGFNFARENQSDTLKKLAFNILRNVRSYVRPPAKIFWGHEPVSVVGKPSSQFSLVDVTGKSVAEGDALTARISIMNVQESIERKYIE